MHKPQTELASELAAAERKVEVGALYYHYKKTEDLYRVINLAVTEWDDEPCVIYQAQYGKRVIFVRPLASWLEKAEWKGRLVDRFVKVGGGNC